MPTLIRLATTTEEINDVLSVRRHALQAKRGMVDPFDLYPETVNLVAYRDGKPVGVARFVLFREDHSSPEHVYDFSFDFRDANRQLPEPTYLLDWFVILPGLSTEAARILTRRLFEYGVLLLARRQAKSLMGLFPADRLAEGKNDLESFNIHRISEGVQGEGNQRKMIPFTLSLQDYYLKWVAQIRDREILRFQDVFFVTLYEPGEIMFYQGDKGSTAFLLQEGVVEVVLQKENEIIPIAELSESQLVGEIAMITQEVRTASLIAKTTVSCITIERQSFLQTLERSPHLSMDIFKIFSKRISEANRRIVQGHA